MKRRGNVIYIYISGYTFNRSLNEFKVQVISRCQEGVVNAWGRLDWVDRWLSNLVVNCCSTKTLKALS